MKIQIIETKKPFENPEYEVLLDGQEWDKALEFTALSPYGILAIDNDNLNVNDNPIGAIFQIKDAKVIIFFGDKEYYDYENPAQEIARRIKLIRKAFEKFNTSWTKEYTAEIE